MCARLHIRSGFSVVLISDEAMRRFNRQFAGEDQPTDVLSFPADGSALLEPGENNYLGDILVSVETADRQKKAGLEEEIKVLMLHGLLHLLGYDHAVDQGEMEQLENRLKGEFSLS